MVTTMVTTMAVAPEAEAEALRRFQRTMLYRQIAHVNALRALLRGDTIAEQQAALLDPAEATAVSGLENPPVGLMQGQGRGLAEAATLQRAPVECGFGPAARTSGAPPRPDSDRLDA